jgi:uncharacterized protein HemX
MEATPMKLVGVISTAVLSLVLGVAAPLFAQEQHEQEEQRSPRRRKRKSATRKGRKAAEKPEAQQEKNAKPEEKNAKQEEKNAKPAEKNAQREQHAANNGGGRIPADKFKANFGQQHTFRVSQGRLQQSPLPIRRLFVRIR